MIKPVFNFGKHAGKTVEQVMVEDGQYLDWIVGQAWFSEKFPDLHGIVSGGNTTADNPTPDHNRLQALFLEDWYCLAFAAALGHYDKEILFSPEDYQSCAINVQEQLYEPPSYEEAIRQLKLKTEVEFEPVDVSLYWTIVNWIKPIGGRYSVEIKPSIGDDYPVVLRKMKANMGRFTGQPVLFVDQFSAVGVTKEQMVKMFNFSGIAVVWKENVDEIYNQWVTGQDDA